MPRHSESQAPAFLRWLVLCASWMIPRPRRSGWRGRQERELNEWWRLVQLGELSTRSSREIVRDLRQTCLESVLIRMGRWRPRLLIRGPLSVLGAGCALFAFLALVSRNFLATRGVLRVFRVMLFAPENLPQSSFPRHGSDTVFAFSAPIVFALAVAILFAAFRHLHLRTGLGGWRYWLFLTAKLSLVLTLVPLAWIELSALVRAQIAPSEYRVLLTGLLFRIIFVVVFVYAFGWCFTDQQRRCPICLRRLSSPVSIGNRSNVFEPALTELLCERGHGALSMPEVEGLESDRWTAFDPSWDALFEPHGR